MKNEKGICERGCIGPTCRKVMFNAMVIQQARCRVYCCLCRNLDYRKHLFAPIPSFYANALNKQSLIPTNKTATKFLRTNCSGTIQCSGRKQAFSATRSWSALDLILGRIRPWYKNEMKKFGAPNDLGPKKDVQNYLLDVQICVVQNSKFIRN